MYCTVSLPRLTSPIFHPLYSIPYIFFIWHPLYPTLIPYIPLSSPISHSHPLYPTLIPYISLSFPISHSPSLSPDPLGYLDELNNPYLPEFHYQGGNGGSISGDQGVDNRTAPMASHSSASDHSRTSELDGSRYDYTRVRGDTSTQQGRLNNLASPAGGLGRVPAPSSTLSSNAPAFNLPVSSPLGTNAPAVPYEYLNIGGPSGPSGMGLGDGSAYLGSALLSNRGEYEHVDDIADSSPHEHQADKPSWF
jgi:hypothetical protein